jgi:hypothetical protein
MPIDDALVRLDLRTPTRPVTSKRWPAHSVRHWPATEPWEHIAQEGPCFKMCEMDGKQIQEILAGRSSLDA